MTTTTKSATASEARVFVASDNVDDAQQIASLIKVDFPRLCMPVDPEKSFDEFAAFRPDVLVLAFDSLAKAQQFHLGLYRLAVSPDLHRLRAVLLCSKDEVQAAFELCKREYFDDYVLYWPLSHDANRLRMSIWSASRKAAAMQAEIARPSELLAHGRHLGELERIVAAPGEAASADDLRRQMEPALAGTRPLGKAIQALKPLILIVDDDPLARRLTQLTLNADRWDVALATDGGDALALLRRRRPDVILMDVQMPGMSGIELTDRLKASPDLADIPVIMMTGNARRETLSGSMEAGAAAFMVKPVTREALEAKLAKVFPR